jgi:hypothetical protein
MEIVLALAVTDEIEREGTKVGHINSLAMARECGPPRWAWSVMFKEPSGVNWAARIRGP